MEGLGALQLRRALQAGEVVASILECLCELAEMQDSLESLGAADWYVRDRLRCSVERMGHVLSRLVAGCVERGDG